MITKLRITGMTCNNCVRHVDRALRGVPGVAGVQVSLEGHAAEVVHDDATTLDSLVRAVESAGYEAARNS